MTESSPVCAVKPSFSRSCRVYDPAALGVKDTGHRPAWSTVENGLTAAVREVLAHGTTSGADTLAGFLWMGCWVAEVFVWETPIIASTDAFKLHTAEAHSDPGVKVKELIFDGAKKGRGEIMGKPGDNPVEVSNDVLVEVMVTNGKGANSITQQPSR